MNYQAVPVSSRIAASVAALLLFVAGITWFAIDQMATIEGNLEHVIEVNTLRVRLNHQLSESTHVVTRVLRTVMLLPNMEQKKIEMRKVDKALKDYNSAWASLQKIPTGEKGQALRVAIASANDALQEVNDRLVQLALENKLSVGTELLLEEVIPATQKVQDLIAKNLAHIEAGNQYEFANAKAQVQRAKYVLISFNALLTLVAALLGWAAIQFITRLKGSEEANQLAATVFKHTQEAILITDAGTNIIDVNESFTTITGYSRAEVLGKNPRILKSDKHDTEFFRQMFRGLSEGTQWAGEKWNRHKDGRVYPTLATVSAVLGSDGQIKNFFSVFSDITQLKAQQHQLEHDAHYDALTHLPNRVLLADRLQQAMAQCQRRERMLAVAYLDIDGFKAINDRHGHNFGDQVLIELSQRMKAALREGDTLSRLGGDEFVAILADLDQPEDCQAVLQRMLEAASTPIEVDAVTLKVSASIGVTVFPQDNADADQLLRHADQAMYVAKAEGKDRYSMFDVVQDSAVKEHRESLLGIRSAIDNDQFVLYYQPKVNVKTGAVVGSEALIRWQHPERGLLAPGVFLPMIEGHTISVDLGEWVIRTALQQTSSWCSAGLVMPVSVNVSALQLQDKAFVAKLTTALAAHPELPVGLLELEIVETSALEDVAQVSMVMRACQALGVGFALDDFGTGYSSLTYLKRLPAGLLKIDQGFVRDMLTDPDDLAIVQGVIGLASVFKRGVIAEGVETQAHAVRLLELGCEQAQGYGIARPMPAAELQGWVERWHMKAVWAA